MRKSKGNLFAYARILSIWNSRRAQSVEEIQIRTQALIERDVDGLSGHGAGLFRTEERRRYSGVSPIAHQIVAGENPLVFVAIGVYTRARLLPIELSTSGP